MWPEFKLVQDFMAVLVSCKFDDNPVKNEDAIVYTTSFCSRAGNSEVDGRMWLEFELVRDFIAVLVTCKFDDSIKNNGTIVTTTFSPLEIYGGKSWCSKASNSIVNCPIWPKTEHRDFMPVQVTCK